MSVISREIISDNFVGINLPNRDQYTKQQLCDQIDKWKYFLINDCNAKKGDKILIGVTFISVNFLALCFACFELSLVLIIADEDPVRIVAGNKIVNPKIDNFMPLDILIWGKLPPVHESHPFYAKYNFYKQNSKIYREISDFKNYVFPDDLSQVSKIRPEKTDIFMATTSSGSTGTAKVVKHTHEFFYKLCIRNSNRFKGNAIHIQNMHHGSSLSVFYLPSLISADITKHYFMTCSIDEVPEFVSSINGLDLNHISFPYGVFVSKFFTELKDQNIKFPDLRISVLSYISAEGKHFIEQGYIKEIESIFGSNETAGPVFLSTLTKNNIDTYNSKEFYVVDDFYGINLSGENLEVTLPVYNTTIRTNDLFKVDAEVYTHLGRSDLIRINDIPINLNSLDHFCKKHDNHILLVTDDVENKIYLLIQKNSPYDSGTESINKLINRLNLMLFNSFNSDRVVIDKYVVEDAAKFISGIKLDNELIREYFRNHV